MGAGHDKIKERRRVSCTSISISLPTFFFVDEDAFFSPDRLGRGHPPADSTLTCQTLFAPNRASKEDLQFCYESATAKLE